MSLYQINYKNAVTLFSVQHLHVPVFIHKMYIHACTYVPVHVCLMTLDSTPSVHSLVFKSNSPYNSPRERDLGLMGKSWGRKTRGVMYQSLYTHTEPRIECLHIYMYTVEPR